MLNDIWQISTVMGLLLQTGVVVEGWMSLQALKESGRNGPARYVAITNLEADCMRWTIMAVLVFVGPHLPLHVLEHWVAISLLTVIWISILIAVRTTVHRHRLLRMVVEYLDARRPK